jgi:hypothetical protein
MTSRLSNDGRLLTEVGDQIASKEGVWIGSSELDQVAISEDPPVAVQKYTSVRVGEEEISLDDCIYLTPDQKGEPCEIGQVKGLFEVEESGEKMVNVQWFWRPEHIEMPPSMRFDKTKELFRSETQDINPIDAIERFAVAPLAHFLARPGARPPWAEPGTAAIPLAALSRPPHTASHLAPHRHPHRPSLHGPPLAASAWCVRSASPTPSPTRCARRRTSSSSGEPTIR